MIEHIVHDHAFVLAKNSLLSNSNEVLLPSLLSDPVVVRLS